MRLAETMLQAPSSSPMKTAKPVAKAYDLSRLNVLVVDDSHSMQMLLQSILRAMNIRSVSAANSVESALGLLRAGFFDLVMLDWVMPDDMDGLQMTRLIRDGQAGVERFVPIIMLSGNNRPEDVCAARDAGVTEYMTKPVSVQSLYKHIVAVIENPRRFVASQTFNGPDRRRVGGRVYTGEERRKDGRSQLSRNADAAMQAFVGQRQEMNG
jgi:two-component system chemotaxis response regulator CheY